ncbi:MAG: dephospho-CoA kinase [Clostridiales bacterium]|nr:dephospho-CoA kinase [Clostridiales bacterium]
MRFKRNERTISEFNRDVRVVGLTGGIASGKTVAAAALRNAGYVVIDADEISRALTAAGSDAEKSLAAMFGTVTAGGKLDRAALRKLIAQDGEARKKLDAFTHPLIIEKIKTAVAAATPPIIISAPLLFETALSSLCDAVVCIVCPRRIRIERIMSRDGLSHGDAERMVDMQLPDSVRATLSEFCVPSDVGISDFQAEIVELFDTLFKRTKV